MKLDRRPEFLTKIFQGLTDCLSLSAKRMHNLSREDLIPLHDCTSMISDYLKQNLGIEIEEPDVESTFDSAIKFLQIVVLKLKDVHSAEIDNSQLFLQKKLKLVRGLSKEEDEETKLSLMCTICEQRYDLVERKPLVLLCGHTFCKDCH